MVAASHGRDRRERTLSNVGSEAELPRYPGIGLERIVLVDTDALADEACAALLAAATGALAGTTGTEFQSLYTWLTGLVQGYFGKAAAVAAIGLGALFSLARLNPIAILSGIGFAVFLQYAPTIASGILTATI